MVLDYLLDGGYVMLDVHLGDPLSNVEGWGWRVSVDAGVATNVCEPGLAEWRWRARHAK